MAVTKNGRTIYYPHEKAKKYGDDLRAGCETVGSKSTAKGQVLTERQKAYRAGYLKANRDHYGVYLAKNPDKKAEYKKRKEKFGRKDKYQSMFSREKTGGGE